MAFEAVNALEAIMLSPVEAVQTAKCVTVPNPDPVATGNSIAPELVAKLFDTVKCVKIMVVGATQPTYTLSDRIVKL